MYGTPIDVILCASPGSTPHLKIPGWRSLQCRLIQWLTHLFTAMDIVKIKDKNGSCLTETRAAPS
jgi:hypothetical protein